MRKLNLMKEYENARLYILDVCDYEIEVIVACYKIYQAMMEFYPKSRNRLLQKDFVANRFFKYIAKNYKKREIKILYDYYFDYKSYKEIANEYNITPYEVMKSLKNTIWGLNKINTTSNWFVMSQRKAWVEEHLREIVEQEIKYRKTKAVTEWVNIEDMGLSKRQQLILQKHNIITLKELLEAEETYLFKLLGKANYNSFKAKLDLAKSVL